jgi:hypothetical protein
MRFTEEQLRVCAEREAKAWAVQSAFERDPSVEKTYRWEEYVIGMESETIKIFSDATYSELKEQGKMVYELVEARNAMKEQGWHRSSYESIDAIVDEFNKRITS